MSQNFKSWVRFWTLKASPPLYPGDDHMLWTLNDKRLQSAADQFIYNYFLPFIPLCG